MKVRWCSVCWSVCRLCLVATQYLLCCIRFAKFHLLVASKGAVSPILNSQKNMFESMELSKKRFSFVYNNPTNAQKLVLIMFGWGLLGWKWFFLCIVDKSLKTDYTLFFPG